MRRAWIALATPGAQRALHLLAPVVVVAGIGFAEVAEARIGGGQTFRGGGGSRGRSGGGGGGDIPIDLIILLLIEYPAIGVPVLLAVVAVMIVRASMQNNGGQRREVGHGAPRERTARRPRTGGLDKLRRDDPGFSMPVLQDFLVMLYQRVYGAAAERRWAPLAPFVAPTAQAAVTKALGEGTRVDEVVVGSVQVASVRHGNGVQLTVQFAATRVEERGGRKKRKYVEERWTLRRGAGAVSLPPEDMLRMGCPSCGAAIETTALGACTNCDTPITKGQLQWQVHAVQVLREQGVTAPEVGFFAGGDEPSAKAPTRVDPHLPGEVRKLKARHPDFDFGVFHQRVQLTYRTLQEAWSEARYLDIRPYVTDPMYQSLRFWVDKYRSAGLRNELTDIRLHEVKLVKVELDAWYEAITVRIWGSMKDTTVDADGKVVGGNPKVARRFSEYWTFLRAAGGPADAHVDTRCPSCGAPLDNVDHAGVCGYCDTKITNGRFDWVLSRIDQPEAYRG